LSDEVKPHIDDQLCVGTGVCEATAPNLFEVGDDGVAHALLDVIPPDQLEAAKEAATSCPTRALSLR
jgi:ferredoxin